MPKFQVVQYFQIAKTYIVKAGNEDEALDIVDSGEVKLEFVGDAEFAEDSVLELTGD